MKRNKSASELSFSEMVERILERKGAENLAKSHKNSDLNTKSDQSFPDTPLTSEEHAHPHWTGYNDNLFHGITAHKNLAPEVRSAKTSKFIQVGGFEGRDDKTVLKAPLDWKGLKLHHKQENPDAFSHFLNRDFQTSHREAAFHDLSKHVFAMDHFVPPTTVFRHPKTNRDWSAQKYISNATPFINKGQLAGHTDSDLHKLALMESVLGHNDRNKSNVVFDEGGRMKLIDNALSFDYSHRYGTPVPSYAAHLQGSEVPKEVHNWIDTLSGDELGTRLSNMGAPSKVVNAATSRLNSLKEWSDTVRTQKGYSQDLAGGLEVVRSHRINPIGSGLDNESTKRAAWSRIESGRPYVDSGTVDDETVEV